MKASIGCLALLLLFGGLWGFSNAEEDPDHIFSSDPVLLAIGETSSTTNSWLTCASKECIFSKRQTRENVYTHRKKVFRIYANERSRSDDPIRYGDEVALFYKESNEGLGLWLSCESDRQQCGLGTCPGLPHFKHWMWNTESCQENRFIIASSDAPKHNTVDMRYPLKVGDEIHFIRKSDKLRLLDNSSLAVKANGSLMSGENFDMQTLGGAPFTDGSSKWIIQKDMIEKCGETNYDVRYNVCDRCGSQRYLRPKDESWQCCAGEKPYNPAKSLCCEGSVSDLSNDNRDAKEARCCGVAGYFPDVQKCCLGKVHYLPGQYTDADDSTVQCCGDKPFLTSNAVCCNNALTSLATWEAKGKNTFKCCGDQGFIKEKSFCLSCGKMTHVLPLSEKASWSCCKNKDIYKSDESKCCDYGVEKGKQCRCVFNNSTYISGERFSDQSSPSSCRTCVCQDGNYVCDTVTSCPAILPQDCSFYPANGECCPVFECFDFHRDNNHQIFLRRKSHVSANAVIPELEEVTISFWMKTEQDSEGTLLSYATDSRKDELVIRTHPTFRWTFKGTKSTEFNKKLNDGAWHFVCTQWKSSTGVWTLFVDSSSQSSATFNVGTGRKIERHGYLVLGRQQNPRTNLIEEGAFIGEIAYFNVWDSKINFINKVKSDCLGLYEGNLIRWSVGTTSIDTIDTHHSASIIKADICTGPQAKPEYSELDVKETPKEHVFVWEAVGTTLESLTGANCAQSPVYRIRSTEHSFQLKVCPSSTTGSLGNLHVFVAKGNSDSPLYWPFPYTLKLSVIVNSGNPKVEHDMNSGSDRRKSKAWSLNTGSCSNSGAAQDDVTTTTLNPESSTWLDFITLRNAQRNYKAGKLRIEVKVHTEKYGGWLYWNGHYYSHRDRIKEKTWFSAEADCVANGASVHLVSIHSQRENDFVKSRASDEQWIGVSDHNDLAKSFAWVDGSTYGPPGYTNWATNEPKQNTKSASGDCGTMKTDGKWADTTCEYTVPSSLATAKARGYTCKTPGKSFDYQAPTLFNRKVTQRNEVGVFSVDIVSSSGQTIKVTFFTCLRCTAPNMKYTTTSNKVKYAANMEFGHYVDMTVPQLGSLYDKTTGAENDVSGVADLDGVVDKIKIPHYANMDNVGNTAFSFEFWLRPRRMPLPNEWMALFSKSSSSSGFISLNLKSDGTLQFTVAPNSRTTPLTFVTSITTGDCKITSLKFQFIAVTGNVGSSLKIVVNGDTCYSTNEATSWGDVTSLPASSEGPLMFGDSNSQDTSTPQKFNGQIAYIRLFDKERTAENIKTSMDDPYTDSDAPLGSWPLRQSKEIKLIHYVISDANQVSDVKVLEDFDISSSCFPVVAFERNRKITLFRLTETNDLVAKKYKLSTDNTKLEAVSADSANMNTGSDKAERGCFTVAYNKEKDCWLSVTCKETKQNPREVIFTWRLFKMSSSDEIIQAPGDGNTGSIRVVGIGSLDTRPSATIVGDHLLLTAGTTNHAKIFFLDLKLDTRSRPSVPIQRVVALSVGPRTVQAGVSYYCYIHRPAGVGDNTKTSQSFLRRVRPPQGSTSTYTIQERKVNPSTLTAKSPIDSDMPENDWFWFLFRITTLSGGNVIQSGQRILVQTPDNNPQNKRQWSFVKADDQTLRADQHGHMWNFWIFKTKTCDPTNGGYTIRRGEIGPDDCVLLWPNTLQFGPNCFCTSILAFPTEQQIQGARKTFASWFVPLRLMVPLKPTPVRPLPQPSTPTSTISQPRNVYEGNKYALLHFGEGIKLPSQSGEWAALLQFAQTTMAPVIVDNSGNTPPVKLVFRGNGGPLPLVGAFGEAKIDQKKAFDTIYREGSFAQKRMTSGLFYSVGYTPSTDASSPGEFKNLGRIAGLKTFEYPEPPQNFIWLVPPPFKVNGVCEAVSKLLNIADDTIQTTDPNSVASLTEVIKKATGPGSFGEGLFKPLLTVHFDVKLLHKIGAKVHKEIVKKIQSSLPHPPGGDSTTVRDPDPKWQTVGDVEACLYLSSMKDWWQKVEKQRIEDKLHQLFTSEWMREELIKITRREAPAIMHDASLKYSSYGGIAVLIANRLRGTDFLESLLIVDLQTLKLVLQSFLPVLDAIRPDLGIDARKDIVSTLLARSIIDEPWNVLRAAVDEDKKKKALGMAFDTLVGKLVPKELLIETKDILLTLFRTLFSPMTSTQLAIVERTLNIDKTRALAVEFKNAREFKERFLHAFKGRTAEDIATFNQPVGERSGLPETTESQTWLKNHLEAEDLRIKQFLILRKFQRDVMTRTNIEGVEPFRPTSNGFIKRWLVENPTAFARVSFAFNAIGTLAATGSLLIELSDPNSDLRQGSPPAILAAVATVVGAAGSFKGVYDFAVELKAKLYPRTANTADVEEIPLQQLNRQANDMEVFDRYVGKSFRVDMEAAERVNTRLFKYFDKAALKMTKFFLALGVVADVIFFGISIYNIVEDFKADKRDPWKIVDDFGLAIAAGAGAVVGILSIIGFETGPVGIFIFLIGLAFIISDAIRARKEAERKLREARCKAWTKWCKWGKALFLKCGALKDPSVDPCKTCPITKRHLLRELCMNGHLSAAHRLLLGDRLGPSKDARSLGQDVGMVEHKTCPAWMRHFYKRRGTRKDRKGKGKP